METPGMVAAKDNSLPGAPDLNVDSLPGQNQDEAPTHQATDEPPTLPQTAQVMDSDQLHLQMSAKLQAPNPIQARAAGLQQKQAELTVQKPPPPPADEIPMPISQQPQISPVHAPVANPYDILNR
jgi:hypothetical protein